MTPGTSYEHSSRRLGVSGLWLTIGIGLLVLVAFAALFDAAVTRTLMSWPAPERWFFELVTWVGQADWILIPSLIIGIVGFLARGLHLSYTMRWTVISLHGLGWYIFIGVGAPSLVATLLKRLIGRARPIHLDELGALSFHPFQADWSLAGFPSGHATTAFASAVILSALFSARWRVWFFVVAFLVALSRVVIGMHFLTDVVAGAALGTYGATLVRDWFMVRKFPIEFRKLRPFNRTAPPLRRLWTRTASR